MATVPSRAAFLAAYPDYNALGVAGGVFIDAKLAEAARSTDATVFQSAELTQDAVLLRAAVLLLASPKGLEMRKRMPDQAAAWEWRLRAMQRTATMGRRAF